MFTGPCGSSLGHKDTNATGKELVMQEPCVVSPIWYSRSDATGTVKKLLRKAGHLISSEKPLISQSHILVDITVFCRAQEHDGKHQWKFFLTPKGTFCTTCLHRGGRGCLSTWQHYTLPHPYFVLNYWFSLLILGLFTHLHTSASTMRQSRFSPWSFRENPEENAGEME